MKDSFDEYSNISEALKIIKAEFKDKINYHKAIFEENKMLNAIRKLNEEKEW